VLGLLVLGCRLEATLLYVIFLEVNMFIRIKLFKNNQNIFRFWKLLNFISVALLFIIIVSACASTAKYEAILNTWIGADVNNLIASWGPPSEEYSMPNGNKMYTWLWVGNTLVTSNYNKFLNMTLTNAVTFWCKTTFTVDNYGRISGWHYEGNACMAN